MDDPVTRVDWAVAVVAAGVGGFIAGVIAILAALLTVRLTQRGDRRAATMAKAYESAEQLEQAVLEFERSWRGSGPGKPPDFDVWNDAYLIHRPVIDAAHPELAAIVEAVNDEFRMYSDWAARSLELNIDQPAGDVHRSAYLAILQMAEHAKWLMANSARFRTGQTVHSLGDAPSPAQLIGIPHRPKRMPPVPPPARWRRVRAVLSRHLRA